MNTIQLDEYSSFFDIFRKQFPEPKKEIAFIDGDNGFAMGVETFYTHLYDIETVFVYAATVGGNSGGKEPKVLRDENKFRKIRLSGFTTKKEIADKYIAAAIQKAVDDGYNNITVVSSDYDFVEIFKLVSLLNQSKRHLNFKLIIPNPQGRLTSLPEQLSNIKVIKL
jgi:hypothetical protein